MIINWFLPTTSRDFNNMSASVWIRALQLFPYLEKKKNKNIVNEEESQADISIFVRRQSIFDQQLAVKQKTKDRR